MSVEQIGYLYFGRTQNEMDVAVPYPTVGDVDFGAELNVDTRTNANGALVFQSRGRARHTNTIGWGRIECEAWWALNRWVQKHGPLVWCQYFNHNTGEWAAHKVLLDKAHCAPEMVDDEGRAPYYVDASIEITDTGGD